MAYSILPFNFTHVDGRVVLVNETGVFHFLNERDFDLFTRKLLPAETDEYANLESKLFLASSTLDLPVRMLAARYRSRMRFLEDFTSLHMVVLTARCNQKCSYCQVSSMDENAGRHDMSMETARRVTDFIFNAPGKNLKMEFQGGEPSLNWPALAAAVEHAERLAEEKDKNVDFVVCTNLLELPQEHLDFYRDHKIQISTSLDGPQALHDRHRIARIGGVTHAKVLQNIKRCRHEIGPDSVSALMTASRNSLPCFREIIDEYVNLGMDGIFFRSLNPYGMAAEMADVLSYPMEDFVDAYLDALEYIFEINKARYFPEYFATLLFTRMLTWQPTGFVDLQNPAGAGIQGAIYDYDGSIYPADEARMLARMGDRHFLLGNVRHDSFHGVFSGQKLRTLTRNSMLETSLPCAWCAFKPYCGSDPVRNHLESGKEGRNMAGTPFCRKHKGIFEGLFKILLDADEKRMDTIWSWIIGNPALVEHEAT